MAAAGRNKWNPNCINFSFQIGGQYHYFDVIDLRYSPGYLEKHISSFIVVSVNEGI